MIAEEAAKANCMEIVLLFSVALMCVNVSHTLVLELGLTRHSRNHTLLGSRLSSRLITAACSLSLRYLALQAFRTFASAVISTGSIMRCMRTSHSLKSSLE